MPTPVLIFGVGNESRGDDAIAPLLLRRLQMGGLGGRCELIEEFQLQVEHTLDMLGRELVLLVDAGMQTPDPFSFYRAEPGAVANLYSHALSPEALLALFQQVHQQPAPPLYVLCVRGEQFELGQPVSAAAQDRLQQALAFVQSLLQQAEVAAWQTHCQRLPGEAALAAPAY